MRPLESLPVWLFKGLQGGLRGSDMDYYNLARGLHILAVIAWMAGMLFLPRLFAYDAEQNAKPEPLRGEMQALLLSLIHI